MYNLKKGLILAILFLLFVSINSTVFASEINMNLSRETNSTTNSINNTSITSAVVSTVENVEDSHTSSFGINTILDILLIAIGFVIILLAIAILIRLKNN